MIQLMVFQEKSWADLWEEDLQVFEAALEKQERKERGELEETIKKATKKLASDHSKQAMKRMKIGLAMVQPNPNALRIAPTIDAMKEKYEPKVKKERAPKKPKTENGTSNGQSSITDFASPMDIGNDGGSDVELLDDTDRPAPSSKPAPAAKPKAPAKPRSKPAGEKKAPAAAKRKRKNWEESNDEEVGFGDVCGGIGI